MRTQKAAVIGHPLGHTMSPFIHERLFRLSGIPAEYQVLDIPDLPGALPALRELDCFNVTIPYKSAILPFLEGIDPAAETFGSVNTVQVKAGKMYGYTTDGAGWRRALETHRLCCHGPVLLLGNGGAARAIAFEIASQQRDFHITIAHREGSRGKADALALELASFARKRGDRQFRIVTETYEELSLDRSNRFDLLVNCTSVGMYPHSGESPVPEEVAARCGAVFDIVYNPSRTRLLQLAEGDGIKAIGGMEMLVYQAVAAHEIWYGSRFRPEDLKALCRDAEREMGEKFKGGRV